MIIDFDKLDEAGVLPAHLARMCKVSRAAATHWKNGQGVGPKHQARVKQVLDLVERAMQSGRLPLSPDIRQRDRFNALASALVAASKESTEPPTDN